MRSHSTNASLGGGVLSYLWDFGDGTTSALLAPSKIYNAAGTYVVKLVVTGLAGLDSLTRTVHVIEKAVTGFGINDSIQPLSGNSFTFNTLSAVAGNTYKWAFSDGTFSTDVNPLKTYFSAGTFEVKQIVTAVNGCKDSLIHLVIVESDSVGSGNGGGLESKSLGGMVTKRDFLRLKNNIDPKVYYDQLPVYVKQGGFGKAGVPKLSEMLPQHLDPNDVPRISTPADLLNLTIAIDVLSVDYTINNQAKAAALGIKTANRAYNHTKPVCDRLRAATLVSVDTVHIQNYIFTQFALKQEDNTVEYGISFVAGTKAGRSDYSLQTGWLISQYINDDTMYTFQVWSTQPAHTHKLVSDILNNLNASMPVIQLDQPGTPRAFVTHGERNKENLVLTIQNTTDDLYGKVVFEQRLNEQSGTNLLEIPVTLPRFGTKQISIAVEDGYEYEGMIYLDNRLEDAIYMADGNWGLDYDAANTTVPEYITANDPTRVYADNEYAVYRGVSLKWNTNDYMTVYKAISQGNSRTNLVGYNNLKFFAKGTGQVSVRLTKDAIVSWNDQYSTTITLDTTGKFYDIPFSQLVSPTHTETFVPNDIKLLGFTFVSGGAVKQDYNFMVKDIAFNNTTVSGIEEEQSLRPVGVYPNPNEGSFSVSFKADDEAFMDLVVTDVLGKTVFTKKVMTVAGENISRVDLASVRTGFYFVTLKGTGKPYKAVKVFVD